MRNAFIDFVRWSPAANKLAISADKLLYVVDVAGNAVPHLLLRDGKQIEIQSLAWSPDGKEIVFRSSYQAGEDCKFNLGHHFDTGHMPCRPKFFLYTANSDGSGLKQVSKIAEYRPGTLCWIR